MWTAESKTVTMSPFQKKVLTPDLRHTTFDTFLYTNDVIPQGKNGIKYTPTSLCTNELFRKLIKKCVATCISLPPRHKARWRESSSS